MTVAHTYQVTRVDAPSTLAERIAGWVPVAVLAYPLIVWPLAFGVPESARLASDLPSQLHEPNLANRLFYPLVFLAALTAALVVPLARLRPLASAPMVLVLIYFAWATASVAWALEPGIALRRLIGQGCLTGALVLSLLAARDVEAVLMRIFGVFAAAALINVLMVAISPPGPLGHEGIYTQKNTLGAAAALMMLFAICVAAAGRGAWRLVGLAVLAGAALLLVASQSKTALGIALLAPLVAGALLLVGRAMQLSASVLVALGIGLLGIVYFVGEAAYFWDFPTITGALLGDPTLTSRTEIWAFALEMISRRPLAGFGFESFWGIGYEGPVHREAPGFVSQMPDAHNGYLDTVLQTGLVGLAIVVCLLLAVLHAGSSRTIPPRLSWLILCVAVYTIVYNVSESTFFAGLSFGWIMFVLVATLAARIGYEARSASPGISRRADRRGTGAVPRSVPLR